MGKIVKACLMDGCDHDAEPGQLLCAKHMMQAEAGLWAMGLRLGDAPVVPPMPTVDDEFAHALGVEDTQECAAVKTENAGKVDDV